MSANYFTDEFASLSTTSDDRLLHQRESLIHLAEISTPHQRAELYAAANKLSAELNKRNVSAVPLFDPSMYVIKHPMLKLMLKYLQMANDVSSFGMLNAAVKLASVEGEYLERFNAYLKYGSTITLICDIATRFKSTYDSDVDYLDAWNGIDTAHLHAQEALFMTDLSDFDDVPDICISYFEELLSQSSSS